MRLSNTQAMMLFQILRDSCVIDDKAGLFTFGVVQRRKLAQDIINQQSEELIELGEDDLVPLFSINAHVEVDNENKD